jgi:hypothetical protein
VTSRDRLALVLPLAPLAHVLLVGHVFRCGLAASASLEVYRVLCLGAWLTPKTPKRHKRPAAVVSNTVHVITKFDDSGEMANCDVVER